MDRSHDPTSEFPEHGQNKLSGDRRKSTPYKLARSQEQLPPKLKSPQTTFHSASSAICIQPASTVTLVTLAPHSKELNSEGTSGSADDSVSPTKPTKRRLFSRRQLNGLKDSFERNAYPSREEYDSLASSLAMKESSVKQWFQNARAKLRKRGSLSSATKTFYLDRTEPKSPPITPPPEKTSPFLPPLTLTHQQKPHQLHPTPQQQISPIEKQVRPAILSPISPIVNMVKMETMTSPVIKIEPVEEPEEEPMEEYNTAKEDTSIEEDTSSNQSSTPDQQTTAIMSSPGTYQTMTQVALPSDHPFCNLGRGVSSKRRRRRPSQASVSTTVLPTERNITHIHPQAPSAPSEKRRRSDSSSDEMVPKVTPPSMPNPMPMYFPPQYMQAMQSMQMSYGQMNKNLNAKASVKTAVPKPEVTSDKPNDSPLDLSLNKAKRSISAKEETPKSKSPVLSQNSPSHPTPPVLQPMPVYGQPPYMFPMYPMMPMPMTHFPGLGNQMPWPMPKWQPFSPQVDAAK